MNGQVKLAVQKDWKDIQIDKKRLVEEHKEREKGFYEQVALLENPLVESNWKLIKKLKSRMEKEIKTKC